MPQQLSDMTIDEISIVDDPANEQSRVLIVKAKSQFTPCADCASPDKCAEMQKCAASMQKANSDTASKGQAMTGGNSVDPDAAALAAASFQEFQMDIENLSKALEDAEAKLGALEKRADEAEGKLKDAEDVIKAKDAEIETLKKSAEKPAPEPTEEEVYKSLPEAVRKQLDAAKEATEALAKMKAEAEQTEAITKAKTFGVGNADEVGPLLLRVQKGMTTEQDAQVLEQLLKSVGELTKGSKVVLFKSLGSSTATDGEPSALLQAKADEIHKAAEGKLTKEQAYAKAVDENPGLYNDYINKRRTA